jgi:hypothetical protein
MEPTTINASQTTWFAKILANRRLEIIQSLLKLYPTLNANQLKVFYEASIPQNVPFAELSRSPPF